MLLVIYNIPLKLAAQDGHYWTQHYGTRSILLSNSAIGGVNDLAALYYNPARLSLIENPAFLLNADVFEVSQIKFDNAVGEGASRSKTDFGSVPSFVAGTFKIKWLEGHYFGYSILQRQNINLDFNYNEETLGDVIGNFPGEEYFGANTRFNQKIKEEWYSLSWSYPIKSNLSVGLTASATRLALDKGTLIELQALSSANQVAQYQFDRNYSMNQYGLLLKMGVAGEGKLFNWGFTLTTPSLQILSKGQYNYQEFFSGIQGSTNPDKFTTNRQKDIETEYKRPLAIGGGISIPVGRSELFLSSEWYSSVNRYTLLEVESHISQSDGDTVNFALVDDLSSVTNFGIGAQIYVNEKFSTYLSVSSDFSAAPDNRTGFAENKPVANNTVFNADFFHFAGGVVLNWKRADITLGAAYTGGDQEFARPVDFPDEGDDGIFEMDETGSFRWNRMRVIFSFSFPFLKDRED
ncbi:MAG: hypothetical protein DHS20C17_26770 [Cyclobacteriaceae bacterium]|nr:MAG: hypothetical protein DHS20C17_26770 [Cyclobacteriaceae bacterium]